MSFSFKENVMGGLWRLTKKGACAGFLACFDGIYGVKANQEERTEEGFVCAFAKKRIARLEFRQKVFGDISQADKRELDFLKQEYASGAHLVTKNEIAQFRIERRIGNVVMIAMVIPFTFFSVFVCASYVIDIIASAP